MKKEISKLYCYFIYSFIILMFSSTYSFLEMDSIGIIDLNMRREEDQDENQNLLNSNQNQFNSTNLLYSKIRFKALFSFLKIVFIGLFYMIDGNSLEVVTYNLVMFLLIHEFLVISNFSFVYLRIISNRVFSQNNIQIPKICTYVNILSNLIFFIWFIYGNIILLTDKSGMELAMMSKIFIMIILFIISYKTISYLHII